MIKAAFRRAWLKENELKDFDDNQNNNVATEQKSPVIRIHPPEHFSSPHGSPISSTKWSPAINRTNKDQEILFELPPLSPERFPTKSNESLVIDKLSLVDNNNRQRSLSFAHFGSSNPPSSPIEDIPKDTEKRTHQRVFSVDSTDFYRRKSEVAENNGLGKIEPELYRTSPISCRSRCGRVWFSLVYDGAIESLTVKIIKIKQLPPRSTGNNLPRDSFVKLFLLPDEKNSQQTKVRHHCNHPVFNESFSLQIPNSEIRKKVLRLSVYDEDKRKSSRCLLGHALINLEDVDFTKANEEMWRDLDDIAKPGDTGSTMGELYVSLTYIPSAERLSTVVKAAKNLRKIDLDATGIHVKVLLFHGNNVIKTKKTSSKPGMPELDFNESFQYKISPEDMKQTSLTFIVVTRGKYGSLYKFKSSVKNAVSGGRYGAENKYGEITIGSYHSTGEQSLHWQEILSQAPKTITKWHSLCEVVDNNI